MKQREAREMALAIAADIARETMNLTDAELHKTVHLMRERFPKREFRNATGHIWAARRGLEPNPDNPAYTRGQTRTHVRN